MINWENFEGGGRGQFLGYYPVIYLGGTKETRKKNSGRPVSNRDLNPGPPEYEAGVLTTRPRHTELTSDTCFHL
jgi:hypothetical protein